MSPSEAVTNNIVWVETLMAKLGAAAGVCSCGLALQTAAVASLCTGSLEQSSLGLIQSSCEVWGIFPVDLSGLWIQ